MGTACVYHKGVGTTGVEVVKDTTITDAFKCSELCDGNDECTVWTYTMSTYPDASHRNHCYLKKDGVVKENDARTTGLWSGYRCGK